MLRITLVSRTSEEEVHALEGWIAGEELEVLRQTCGPAADRGTRLVLDLHGVRSIEDNGIDLLGSWAEGGRVRLRRPSAYVRQLLVSRGLGCSLDEEP
ncbi:MAG: STAS domain-containing protein [Candidatus Latescibacterota bacterium]